MSVWARNIAARRAVYGILLRNTIAWLTSRPPMHAHPRLLAVATAVPPYPLDQDDVMERVRLLLGRPQNLDRLLPVFTNTGIRRRYSCVPIEWYYDAHGWAERNRIYIASALDLLEAATLQLLDRSGRDKGDITGVVVV